MAHYPVPAIMGGVIWPISVFETDENMAHYPAPAIMGGVIVTPFSQRQKVGT